MRIPRPPRGVGFGSTEASADLTVRPLADEILYGRPMRWKVFVSSKMRDSSLNAERTAAVEAIRSLAIATPWHWEGQSRAGEYCAEAVCLGHARTSDALVLLVGDTLTPLTRQEYESAGEAGAQRFVFIRAGDTPDRELSQFIRTERQTGVTKDFRNLSELRKHVVDALQFYAVNSGRLQQIDRLRSQRRARLTVHIRLGSRRRP